MSNQPSGRARARERTLCLNPFRGDSEDSIGMTNVSFVHFIWTTLYLHAYATTNSPSTAVGRSKDVAWEESRCTPTCGDLGR